MSRCSNYTNYILGLLILLPSTSAFSQQQSEIVAVANEVVISASPLHDSVAEKYLEAATDGQAIAIADSTNSATKLSIIIDPSLPKGAIVDEEEIDETCKDFQAYIRKLRVQNADARENNQRPKVVYNFQCSPNAIFTTSAVPNDSRLSELWAVDQSNNIDLDLPEAWDKSTGSNQVVVAIIDTGVDYNHPDLAANMWKNPLEVNGIPGYDDDANGYIDDIYGINAINGSGNPMDDNSHGTHVAGTIGGVGNNGYGVVGAAWNVKIMGAKFLAASGSGSLYDAVKATDYVTNQRLAGVNVILSNNSWGGGGFYTSLRDAINRSNNAGVLFVAAAGNNSTNIDSSPSYPASYDIANVISVGAIDRAGNMASFSNYGANAVDIVAPGVAILSSIPNGGYSSYNGTSMATPQVSGVLALLKAYAPQMSATQLKDTLFNTGKYVPSSYGKCKFAVMPSALQMLLEADRLGYGGLPPVPTTVPTPRPSATAIPTPTRTPTPTPTATIAPGYWNLSGVIKFGNTKIANAKVILEIGGQVTIVYTDTNGNFVINNVLGPVNYKLSVVAGGYTFSSSTGFLTGNVIFNPSGQPKNYALKALVSDNLGQPIANVTVSDPVFGSRITNANGIAEFTVPYGVDYQLTVSDGFAEYLDVSLGGRMYGDVTRAFVRLPE